jgi:hypothetical protein
MSKIDCTLDIVPAYCIGNILQGGLIYDYANEVQNSSLLSISTIENNIRIVEYNFNECIKIYVDVFTGRITEIVAYNHYKGTLNNQIYLGLPVRKLLKIDSTFECCHGGLMSMNFLGICIYFTENFDADVHDLTPYLDNKILGIGLITQYDENGKDNYIELYGEKYFNLYKNPN